MDANLKCCLLSLQLLSYGQLLTTKENFLHLNEKAGTFLADTFGFAKPFHPPLVQVLLESTICGGECYDLPKWMDGVWLSRQISAVIWNIHSTRDFSSMILNPWIGNGYVCPTSCSLEGMFSSMRQLNINQAQVMDPEKKGDQPGSNNLFNNFSEKIWLLRAFDQKMISETIHLNTSQASLSDARVILLPVALCLCHVSAVLVLGKPSQITCLPQNCKPEKQPHRRNTRAIHCHF